MVGIWDGWCRGWRTSAVLVLRDSSRTPDEERTQVGFISCVCDRVRVQIRISFRPSRVGCSCVSVRPEGTSVIVYPRLRVTLRPLLLWLVPKASRNLSANQGLCF